MKALKTYNHSQNTSAEVGVGGTCSKICTHLPKKLEQEACDMACMSAGGPAAQGTSGEPRKSSCSAAKQGAAFRKDHAAVQLLAQARECRPPLGRVLGVGTSASTPSSARTEGVCEHIREGLCASTYARGCARP